MCKPGNYVHQHIPEQKAWAKEAQIRRKERHTNQEPVQSLVEGCDLERHSGTNVKIGTAESCSLPAKPQLPITVLLNLTWVKKSHACGSHILQKTGQRSNCGPSEIRNKSPSAPGHSQQAAWEKRRLYIQDEEGNRPSEEDSCMLQARVLGKLKDLSTGWCLLLPWTRK